MVIEAELLARRRPFAVPGPILPRDDCRCSMRLVWTFSIGVGVGVMFRRAAAAAAEDKLLVEACDAKKA